VLVLGIAAGVALLIPLVTRGSYTRLLHTPWCWGELLFLGLAIQVALEFFDTPTGLWRDFAFGLLVGSYVLVLAFAARNFVVRGMGVVIVGIACNALVIGLNQGMPVKVLPEWKGEAWAQPTVKHHPREPDDKLVFLSDIIVLREPFDTVISFGDLILAVGLCDVAFHASRRPKRRRTLHIDLTRDEVLVGTGAGAAAEVVAEAAASSYDLEPERSLTTRSSALTTRAS
jgi:hypothetical protein